MSWSTMFKPWRIWKEISSLSQRVKGKKLEGNYKGEGLKTGGVIIFGKDGSAKYAYPEFFGYELDMDDFLAAVEAVRNEEITPVSDAAAAATTNEEL
mmetsp:Transcript_7075/g.13089  ORF Transcript_7075/g.13089 Transcript_7075/m.13089 type:complete len:97 (+) Transcript_7075:338-628(+)